MSDITFILSPHPIKRTEYTLEELGLLDREESYDGGLTIHPSIFLDEFYAKNGVDNTLPPDELVSQKYKIISSLVHIKKWDYYNEGNPSLCLLETQLLKENGYNL